MSLSVLQKSGVSTGALADALISGLPSTKSATSDFVVQLLDGMRADAEKMKGPKDTLSPKLTTRLAGLDALAKTLAPAAAETTKPLQVKDQITAKKTGPTRAQQKHGETTAGTENKAHAKRAASKSLFGDAEVKETLAPDLKAAVDAMATPATAADMTALMAAATKAGRTPESIATELLKDGSPLSEALTPHISSEALETLAAGIDQKSKDPANAKMATDLIAGLQGLAAKQTAATTATAAVAPTADLDQTVAEVKHGLEQIDNMLLSGIPKEAWMQTADAFVQNAVMPQSAKGVAGQAAQAFAALDAKVNALSDQDQAAFFAEFGINPNPPPPQQIPGQTNTPGLSSATGGANAGTGSSLNNAGNPAIGSRVNPLLNSQPLSAGGTPGLAQAQPKGPALTQLHDIVLHRLKLFGIQYDPTLTGRTNQPNPQNLPRINWDNPQADPNMSQVTQGGAGAQGGMQPQLSGVSQQQMASFLADQKSKGMTAEQLVDALLQGQGPLAQAGPLGDGMQVLLASLDRSDVSPAGIDAFNKRADGLMQIVERDAAGGSAGRRGNLMSGDDMRQLIQSGQSPLAIAKAIASGKSPLNARMTQASLSALSCAVPFSGAKTDAEKKDYVGLMNQLLTLQRSAPMTAFLPPDPNAPGGMQGLQQGPQGMPGGPSGVRWGMNSQTTGAIATMEAGFMPTGRTSLDLANSIANYPAFSPTEISLLGQIQDPQQRAMQALQMTMQKQALLATMLTNLANMRHEMLKAVAQNFRS